jgi:alpha-L-rhamnosidase
VDTYTLKGDPDGETWTPEFTFHGFQYVELTGFPGTPARCRHRHRHPLRHPAARLLRVLRPDAQPLYQNMVWTQRANFFEMPTDCPQRDERMGWTGDAQIYVRAATCNADIASFYTKWLRDLNDDQWDYGAYPPTRRARSPARTSTTPPAGWTPA